MTYSFRPAIKSQAKPLIGLYAESGCGKTLSALYLARGFAGDGRVGMIETEAGRGEAYAGVIPGGYDVVSLRETFSPHDYGEAITAAEKADLAALIIDSGSHEWEAVGGVLHMAATNQADGKKGPLVWQQPKLDHRRHFIQRLISTPIPLVILCMRARYPMREDKGAKEWKRSEVLVPMQSEDILFEMFCHGWIDRGHAFHGTKYTLDELKHVLVEGQPISYDTGKRLAEWARGASAPNATVQAQVDHAPPGPTIPSTPPPATPAGRRAALIAEISELMNVGGIKPSVRLDLFSTFLGSRTSEAMKDCTIGNLEALRDDLRKRGAAA